MSNKFKTHTVKELLALSAPMQSDLWLVEGLIPKNNISALVGPSDCGKSTLARQLALSVADNKKTFLGSSLHTSQAKVCYVATEDDEISTRAVLGKQVKGLGIGDKLEALSFSFDNEDMPTKLESLLTADKFDLIVIDGWADTFSGNLNNAPDVRNNLKKLSELANKYNCAILLLHHNVKHSEHHSPDKNKVNGSQSFEAKCRAVIELRNGNDENERLLTVVKANGLSRKDKGTTRVLELDDKHLIFKHRRDIVKGPYLAQGKAKFDETFWLAEMAQMKQGKSYEDAIKQLIGKYPGKKVPCKSWFIEKRKKTASQIPDNQTDCPDQNKSITTKNDQNGEQ